MTKNSIVIEGRKIGPDTPPYIIAEMSANHGGSLARARKIIDIAAEAKADAIKFQAYTADSLTLDSDLPDFTVKGNNPWKGRGLYELYRSAATPYEWFPELFDYARSHGVTPFASPFDEDAIKMLESVDCPAYKIASFEAVDLQLISAAAKTGKPLIISTGMCDHDDIVRALDAVEKANGVGCILLKCTSAYPSDPKDANVATVPAMSEEFNVCVGLSDHTEGTAVAVAACALGAVAVEKHVIDSREPPTADSTFSMLPEELNALVKDCNAAWNSIGTVRFGPSPGEEGSKAFRRSLYAVRDIQAGEILDESNVRSIRPGYGLPPHELPQVLGGVARTAIARGTPLSWNILTRKIDC